MPRDASELARRLARDAEAVCRHYLSKGRRQGRYWTVGDVRNTPGRSTFVRLSGPEFGPGAAGHWTDAASAEHGDLLDLIRESCGLVDFRDVAEEARRFLSLPRAEPYEPRPPAPTGSPEAARRLWAMSKPIAGTLAEAYLRARGITNLRGCTALRFHPRCYYRPDDSSPTETWPAMIAAVTDLSGVITGAHRTWLAPDDSGKAPVDTPRRAMGGLLGHAVRFGAPSEVMAAGEGIETMLSLRCALPAMPIAAALSANHLAALLLPPALRSALHRPQRRCGGRRGARGINRTRRSRWHQGAGLVSPERRLQRGSLCLRPRRASGGAAHPTRAAGCRSLHAPNGQDGLTDAGSAVLADVETTPQQAPDSQGLQKGHEVLVLLP